MATSMIRAMMMAAWMCVLRPDPMQSIWLDSHDVVRRLMGFWKCT